MSFLQENFNMYNVARFLSRCLGIAKNQSLMPQVVLRSGIISTGLAGRAPNKLGKDLTIMQSIFLQGSAVDDPFSYPDVADHIQIFFGAKPEISFDQRVHDVHLSLKELGNLDAWASAPERQMPEDGIMPSDPEIIAARNHTLDAVYFNKEVHGCYLACRREDAESLFESVDKVAVYLAARQGVRSSLSHQKFYLRQKDGESIFQDVQGRNPKLVQDGEEISENLRKLIRLSIHFAVAGQLIAATSETAEQPYPKAYFIPHMPGALRSLFQIDNFDSIRYKYNAKSGEGIMTLDPYKNIEQGPRVLYFKDEPGLATFEQSHIRIENEKEELAYEGPLTHKIFTHCVMAPMMREAFQRLGEERVALSLTQHMDIFSLCAPGKIAREEFIRDWVPSV